MPMKRFSKSLIVWAGICARGKIALVFFNEKQRLTGEVYRQMLQETVIPRIWRLYPNDDAILLQDGATCHTARATQTFLEENLPAFIRKNEWPPMSPDANPCDFRLWQWMNRKVYADGHPRTIDELRRKILAAWKQLDNATIKMWMSEFKPRIESIVKMQGKHVENLFNKI